MSCCTLVSMGYRLHHQSIWNPPPLFSFVHTSTRARLTVRCLHPIVFKTPLAEFSIFYSISLLCQHRSTTQSDNFSHEYLIIIVHEYANFPPRYKHLLFYPILSRIANNAMIASNMSGTNTAELSIGQRRKPFSCLISQNNIDLDESKTSNSICFTHWTWIMYKAV